jgi:hypothetical protein
MNLRIVVGSKRFTLVNYRLSINFKRRFIERDINRNNQQFLLS